MQEVQIHYPASPQQVDENIVKPSEEFKKEVIKVAGSILLFILLYLILMVLATALAVLAGLGGIMLISAKPSLITLMIGLGMVGLGIMVLYFLIKFLFAENKVDRSGLEEVKKSEQPELFAFIEKLTLEIGAPFPKKIYFSADVNASVFYNSSFWSMFLPVRKNLQIGLGLVNAVNVSELKAVLAHEFGHFSQRSMKLGSYVYNMNQVIYNMLYDNDGYAKALDRWGNMSGYFQFFASLTVGIVKGIQFILQKMYGLINTNYMSLSRQMEFHADAVAASVAGSKHLITSLRRLEFAEGCYQTTLNFGNTWTTENLKIKNIYKAHVHIMEHVANEYKIPVTEGRAQISAETFNHLPASRLMIKDQWASHPSTDDREEKLNLLNVKADTLNLSAWILFRNPEQVQQSMTDKLYGAVQFSSPSTELSDDLVRERYLKDVSTYKLNPLFSGYWDGKKLPEVDFDTLGTVRGEQPLSDLFTQEVLDLPKQLEIIQRDLESLELIRNQSVPVKTFDFDGKKYTQKETEKLIDQLRDEEKLLTSKIQEVDNRLMAYFLTAANNAQQSEELKSRYTTVLQLQQDAENIQNIYADIGNIVQPVYNGNITLEQGVDIDNKLKLKEKAIKDRMAELLKKMESVGNVSLPDIKAVEKFIAENLTYFSKHSGLNNDAFEILSQGINAFYNLSMERSFLAKKELTNWLASLTNR
jgi:Zn-dependent protease with chaperone function